MKYECYKCLWTTHIKTKMVSHIGRKYPCKNINNIKLEDCREYILNGLSYNEYLNIGINPANYCKSTANYCKSMDLYESSIDSLEIQKNNKNNLICKYCNKTFTRKENLENHLKKSCKMLKDFNNIYEYNEKTFGKNIYKNNNNAGDIYIVQTDYINDNHYKIGITNNIKRRMSSYRCGNTYEPRLHYYISCQDIKLIDNKIKIDLVKYNIKREIFKGDIIEIKNKIVEIIKKEFKTNKVYVHEPDIKIGDLSECGYCNKCFYTKNDLFDHINTCNEYKEYLSKKKEGKFECKYCYKIFSRVNNLTRHCKTCKDKKKTNEANFHMEELVKILNEQKEMIDKLYFKLEKKNDQIDKLRKYLKIENY